MNINEYAFTIFKSSNKQMINKGTFINLIIKAWEGNDSIKPEIVKNTLEYQINQMK